MAPDWARSVGLVLSRCREESGFAVLLGWPFLEGRDSLGELPDQHDELGGHLANHRDYHRGNFNEFLLGRLVAAPMQRLLETVFDMRMVHTSTLRRPDRRVRSPPALNQPRPMGAR
jgi:hypothetical protein